MEALVRDDQQLQRLASACVGAAIGLAAFPTHDFFGVLAGTGCVVCRGKSTDRTGAIGITHTIQHNNTNTQPPSS